MELDGWHSDFKSIWQVLTISSSNSKQGLALSLYLMLISEWLVTNENGFLSSMANEHQSLKLTVRTVFWRKKNTVIYLEVEYHQSLPLCCPCTSGFLSFSRAVGVSDLTGDNRSGGDLTREDGSVLTGDDWSGSDLTGEDRSGEQPGRSLWN